jgi:hypothetical protein
MRHALFTSFIERFLCGLDLSACRALKGWHAIRRAGLILLAIVDAYEPGHALD